MHQSVIVFMPDTLGIFHFLIPYFLLKTTVTKQEARMLHFAQWETVNKENEIVRMVFRSVARKSASYIDKWNFFPFFF